MSIAGQYIIKGKFIGTFNTMQKVYLNVGEKFPMNELHKIKIHRGVVNNSELIDENEFNSSNSQCNFNYINNIQINSSGNWPVKNDRIFSLGEMKLTNISMNNIHLINDKTYGEIEGDIVATVHETPFKEGFANSNNTDTLTEGIDRDNSGNSDSNTYNNGSDFNKHDGFKFTGCLPQITKWLKWILLILFLIFFISSCTKIGSAFKCLFDLWRYEREFKKIKEDADSLQVKLNKIKPTIAPCQIEKYNGTNEPRTFTYNLGKNSGILKIWYNMYTIPDRMEVYYNGKMIAQTDDSLGIEGNNLDFRGLKGFARNKGAFEYEYIYNPNFPTELLVRIIPNQQYSNTKWDFGVECPN